MRDIMREQKLEEKAQRLSERIVLGDKLVEKWAKKPGIGEGLKDMPEDKARSTSIILENQQDHLSRLTETQISTAFSTTPENVMRVVRLGYPNSVRGELFLDWPMQTTRDSIYYLYAQYDSSKRGSTSGGRTIESAAYRFATELVEDDNGSTGDGSTTTFTGTLSQTPVIPYSVRVIVDNTLVGNDNGAGVFPSTTGGDNVPAGISTGTVDYTTGIYSVTFSTAPSSGVTITMQYNYNSESSTQYTSLGQIELQLRDYQFRVRPYPLGVSLSKMTELLLGTTLNIEAEEAMLRGAGDEIKKSLDFQACRLGYFTAMSTGSITFNCSAAAAGEDSTIMRAQAVSNAWERAGDLMYTAIQRGGVSKIYGGPNATSYLKLHKRFDGAGAQPKVGAHRIGSIDRIDIYKVPSSIVPNAELVVVYKNDELPEDVSIAFGTLIPLYKTQKLEYKNLYSEQGVAHFGDNKVLQSKYLARISLTNLPTL